LNVSLIPAEWMQARGFCRIWERAERYRNNSVRNFRRSYV